MVAPHPLDRAESLAGSFGEKPATRFNIEPVPWVYKNLCANRPDSTNLNFALSDKVGSATFTAVDHPDFGVDCTNGSLAHTEKHLSLLEDSGCKFIEVPVDLLTWPEFITRNQIKHVDLLVLDVEGHELSVIDGMQGCPVLPDVFCIEVGHLDLGEIRSKLANLGYVYDVSSQVNAFFIKRDMVELFAFRAQHFQNASAPVPVELVATQITAPAEPDDSELVSSLTAQNEALKAELSSLRTYVEEVNALYSSVVSSKAWKIVERLRRFKP